MGLADYNEGPVVDNKDPLKLGRVRVNLPGVGVTTWAFPLGMLGSGGKKRGGWSPPPVGAEVAVWFKNKDPEHPRYMSGPIGADEAPDEITDAETSPEDAVKVPFAFNGDRYKILVDERPEKYRVALEDKITGDCFELDGMSGGIRIQATAALEITCDGAVKIRCQSFEVNDRKMAPSNKPW